MTDDPFVPEGVDPTKPSSARIYNFFMGGKHNFEVDRNTARQMIRALPDIPLMVQANRAFMVRAARHMYDQGVRQFLDLGSSIPAANSIDELLPDATVVYVDIDPVAVAHGKDILADKATAAIIQGDVREMEALLDHPQLQALLDFNQPIGVFMLALLHFIIEDEQAKQVVKTMREALPAGSFLAISHMTSEVPSGPVEEMLEKFRKAGGESSARKQAHIEEFFEGLEVLQPGVVFTPLWRPGSRRDVLLDEPARAFLLAGVGSVEAEAISA